MAEERFRVIVGRPWDVEEISEPEKDDSEFDGAVRDSDKIQTEAAFIKNEKKSE
jgi:hypothetical protein